MELKIGTIMKVVNRCTNASTTEKLENSSHSTGWSTSRKPVRTSLTSPLRPSSGIQAIMRITLEVQNGIVHNTNSTTCTPVDFT